MRMRVRGIFIVEKLLFQLIEKLGWNEREEEYNFIILSLRPRPLEYNIFLNFSFPFSGLRVPFIGQPWVWFIKENDEKSSSNGGKSWWIQQRENNAGVIVLPAGLRWHVMLLWQGKLSHAQPASRALAHQGNIQAEPARANTHTGNWNWHDGSHS